jgi:tetratricopeptide (TPR) repeat protein
MALSLKSQANAHFTSSRYRESLDLYTASLNKNPFDPIVWSNRAAARLKLEEYGLAIADSSAFAFLFPSLLSFCSRFPSPPSRSLAQFLSSQADDGLLPARAIEIDPRAVKVIKKHFLSHPVPSS